MHLKIFKTLEVILKAYNRQSSQKLIDHNLIIKIILKIPLQSFRQFTKIKQLNPALIAAFMSMGGNRKVNELACIVIDHPLGLSLNKNLITSVEDCIIIGSKGQANNILGKYEQNMDLGATQAIFFKIGHAQFEQFNQHLDSYLSLCEVFFGHIHLVVSCYQASSLFNLTDQLQKNEDNDQFSSFRENGYFRILQERASRITLQQLSCNCTVQRQRWGQFLIFGNGAEGIIVWLTYRNLPLLGRIPGFKFKGKSHGTFSTFWQSSIGCKIFVRKEYIKSKLEELETTVLIFDLREQYSHDIEKTIEPLFETQIRKILTRSALDRQEGSLEAKMVLCERTAKLLDISVVTILKKLIG